MREIDTFTAAKKPILLKIGAEETKNPKYVTLQ